MPIIRNRDFYTQMGPGDVIVSGYFEANPDSTDVSVDGLRVTPHTCGIEEISDPVAGTRYRLTLPGAGSLEMSGVCMAVSPADVTEPILWAKWDYNDADRSIYIELRNTPGPGSASPLPEDSRVYFCAHVYQSSAASPTIIVEGPV